MKKPVLRRILSYTKSYYVYLILAFISAIISVFATLLAPVVIGKALDQILAKNNVNLPSLLEFLIYLAITISVAAFFQWTMNFCITIITQKTVKDIRDDVFEKLQYVPLKYIDKTPHGDLISRVITDVDQISDGLLQGFTQLFSGIISIIGTIIFMLIINVPIAFVVILVTPLSLFVASFIAKSSKSF